MKSQAAETADSFGSKNICLVSFYVFSQITGFGDLSSARLVSFNQPSIKTAPGLDETLDFYATADIRSY